MIISDAQPASQFIVAGTLRPLAITSNKRSPLFPEIPTFAESGIEGVEATNWWAAFLPAGTPKPIQDAYSKALFTILAMPDVKDRFAKLGVEAVPTSMDETKKFLDAEKVKYAKLIKDNNIKAD
jgi:tripartite-type tricarboxylate transporter receptor subunit TctC